MWSEDDIQSHGHEHEPRDGDAAPEHVVPVFDASIFAGAGPSTGRRDERPRDQANAADEHGRDRNPEPPIQSTPRKVPFPIRPPRPPESPSRRARPNRPGT